MDGDDQIEPGKAVILCILAQPEQLHQAREAMAGIAESVVDFLICAVTLDRRWAVFTSDPDFRTYSRVLEIRLHSPRA